VTAVITYEETPAFQQSDACPGSGVSSLRFGTQNVHGWHNRDGADTFETIAALVAQATLDVIALQETSKSKLPALAAHLGGYNWVFSHGVAILSQPALELTDTNEARLWGRRVRQCRARVGLPGGELEMVAVHLDHRRETARMSELCQLSPPFGGVLLGDFNALTKNDYSDAQWRVVADVRAKNSWEPPVSDVTSFVTGHGLTKKRARLEFCDSWQAAPKKKRPLSTCRFGTRIDYIFASPQNQWKAVECEHVVAIPHASDHNLVVATFAPVLLYVRTGHPHGLVSVVESIYISGV